MWPAGSTRRTSKKPKGGASEEVKRAAHAYLLLGFLVLIASLILSGYLIACAYELVFKKYPIRAELPGGKASYFNLTDVPEGYVTALNYTLQFSEPGLSVYLIPVSGNTYLGVSQANATSSGYSGFADVHSRISRIVLVLNSSRACSLSVELGVTYYVRPAYFSLLTIACFTMCLVGMGLTARGFVYFIIYQAAFKEPKAKRKGKSGASA